MLPDCSTFIDAEKKTVGYFMSDAVGFRNNFLLMKYVYEAVVA